MTTNKPGVEIYEPSEKGVTAMRKSSFRNAGINRYVRLSDYEALQAECALLREQRSAMAEHKMAAHQLIGIPASVGICEPIEGFAARPQDIMPAVRDMALKIEDLQAECEQLRQQYGDQLKPLYASPKPAEQKPDERQEPVADNLTKTAPPRIWLQVDYSGVGDRSEPFPTNLGDISWCKDSVGGLEVEYVRADHSEDRWLDGYYEGFKEANRLAYQSPGNRWLDHEPDATRIINTARGALKSIVKIAEPGGNWDENSRWAVLALARGALPERRGGGEA